MAEELRFTVTPSAEGVHGPVRVANTYHFTYDDGIPYYPVGTTCYVWNHQSPELKKETLESFSASPFNKVRFCVFPKHYEYNLKEPAIYPFEMREASPWKPEEYFKNAPRNMFGGIEASVGDPQDVWDFSKPNPVYFKQIEKCIQQLGERGIQADLILFHPYDRWGFSKMTVEQQNAYLKYTVNRFSAFHNIWWAMANEYDLFFWKTVSEWESNAQVVCGHNPYRHLRSIHNCMTMYDHTRAWITHCSMQRVDLYRTAEETEKWRIQYGKPCVLDEIAYEGNLPNGWGNISGEEMTRRFWEGYTRGGYGQHGEIYENSVIWWSHGGKLIGTSPARIAFLKQLMEENGGYMEPLPGKFDENVCSNERSGIWAKKHCILYYYGANRPCRRTFQYPGRSFSVDVIDTWDMTVTNLGEMSDSFTVPLPSKPYMAVRLS